MNTYSIDEILEMAVQTEKLGYQFYTGMADRFRRDETLVKLFTALALNERVHEKTFTNLKQTVKSTEPVEWDEVTNYMRAFVESEFFLGTTKSLSGMDYIKTVKDAVTFALGFEKETLHYFWELRRIVKEKDLVDAVINEEKSHIVALDQFKRSLTQQPGR